MTKYVMGTSGDINFTEVMHDNNMPLYNLYKRFMVGAGFVAKTQSYLYVMRSKK